MKVAIAPVELAGISESLAEGIRENGHVATLILKEPHRFAYETAPSRGVVRQLQMAQRKWSELRHSSRRWARALAAAHLALTAWRVVAWMAMTHHVVVYVFSRTITNTTLELWLLRLLRRKVVFFYCGSDLRPGFMDGPTIQDVQDEPDPEAQLARLLRQQRHRIKTQERWSTLCVAHPAYAHFLTRPFADLAVLGLPSRPWGTDVDLPSAPRRRRVRALHAPSDPQIKGTEVMLRAARAVAGSGVDLHVDLIKGVPHDEVIRAISQCDFVLDQVYSDVALAALGTEAARLGRPTVIAGYLGSRSTGTVNEGATAPSLFVQPEDLEGAIRKMASDHQFREDLGLRARTFVETQWAPSFVARKLLDALCGDPVPDLMFDPDDIHYSWGCGLPREQCGAWTRALIQRFGVSVLQLDDRPTALAAVRAELAR